MMMNKKTEALMKTLLSEPVAVIHSEYEDKPPHWRPSGYRTVAIIDMDKTLSVEEKLEKAFMLTNSIDSAWYKSDKVNYIGPEKTCRSTVTGDFVLIGKDKYVCNSTGWSEV
jgi:hypothetical protein